MTMQQTKVPLPSPRKQDLGGGWCTKCNTRTIVTVASVDPRWGWGPCPTCHRRQIIVRGA